MTQFSKNITLDTSLPKIHLSAFFRPKNDVTTLMMTRVVTWTFNYIKRLLQTVQKCDPKTVGYQRHSEPPFELSVIEAL